MFGHNYNHEIIRKYVVLFGTLFNDLKVNRRNSSNTSIQTINVPIAYGPKEKFINRIQDDGDLNRKVAITLPRISFELTSFTYDSARKENTIHRVFKANANTATINYSYAPVPYNLQFTLYIMVKNAQDGTEIVEQILPFFTPEWTTTVNLIPELGVKKDIPLILNSIVSEDTYEADFEQRRALVWTMDFEMKGYLYGPIRSNVKTIKHAQVDFQITDGGARVVRVESQPTLLANGSPTSNVAASVSTTLINEDDDYGFGLTVTGPYSDGKSYDPVTGDDV